MALNSTAEAAFVVSTSVENKKLSSATCNICDKQFSNERRYFGHLRIHQDSIVRPPTPLLNSIPGNDEKVQEKFCARIKSHVCRWCEKAFYRKYDLTTHLNVHFATNLSICEICGRKFNHVSNLIRHVRTHLGTKPYPCTICGKRFTQISSLSRHKRAHRHSVTRDDESNLANGRDLASSPNIAEKSFTKRQHYCRICGESFPLLILLRRHKKLHAKMFENKNESASSTSSSSSSSLSTSVTNDGRRNIEEEKMLCLHDRAIDTKRQDSSTNLTNRRFSEPDEKINSIESVTERDVSISDILSPYACNDIGLSNSDECLATKLYAAMPNERNCSVATSQRSRFIDFASDDYLRISDYAGVKSYGITIPKGATKRPKMEKSRGNDRDDESFRIKDKSSSSSSCIEICETESLRNSLLRELKFDEIENCDKISEICHDRGEKFDAYDANVNFKTAEMAIERNDDKNIEKIEVADGERKDIIDDAEEPTLRLVITETGEQFYELIINNGNNRLDETTNSNIVGSNSDEYPCVDLNFHDNHRKIMEKENFDDYANEICNASEFLQFSRSIVETPCLSRYENSQISSTIRQTCNKNGEEFFELVENNVEYDKNSTNDIINSSICQNVNANVSHKVSDTWQKKKNKRKISHDIGAKEKKNATSMNNKSKITKDKIRKFRCNECDKYFSTAYNFKQHAGMHFFDQQKFHCDYCDLSFAWKSTLNKHLANNHRPDGPQKFVCEICPKVYGTLSQVNEHVTRDHLKERNHACTICGKSFFKKFDLKTHSRTHTNERPYICRACGKGFHHQSHIIRHERIHSGERPYECNICQRTFTQPGSLKSHRQRHRNVKIDILEYKMDEDDPLKLAVQ